MVTKIVAFEDLGVDSNKKRPLSRCKVPGGWLVIYNNDNITFMPDPEHAWDGSALPG